MLSSNVLKTVCAMSIVASGCCSLVTKSRQRESSNGHLLVLGNALQSIVDVVRYFKWKQTALLVWSPQSINREAACSYLKARITDMIVISGGGVDNDDDVNALNNRSLQTETSNFVILDADKAPKEFFKEAAVQGLFAFNCSWILFSSTFPTSQLKVIGPFRAQVTLVRFNPTMKPLMAVSLFPTSEVSIRDVFRSAIGGDVWRQVEFAAWSRLEGLKLHEKWAKKDIEALGERTVTFTSFHHNPFVVVHFGKPHSGGTVVGGYIKEVFDILLEQGIFRPKYLISWHNTGFGLIVNGSFTGVVGRLARREVDVAMTGLAMVNTRLEVIQYTNHGIYHYYMGICIAKPMRPLTTQSYVLPFQPIVWIACATTTIIALTVLVVAVLYNPDADSLQRYRGFSVSYWILSGSLFLRVWIMTPGMASKIILGTVHVFTVVTFIYYTSLFTSVLSYGGNDLPINNLKDILVHDDYKVIALPSTSFYNHFMTAKNGTLAEIWRKKLSKERVEDLPQTIEDAVQMLKLGKYVLLHDVQAISSMTHADCDIVFANAKHIVQDSHIASRLDFPYIRMISFQFLLFKEHGLVNRILKRIFPIHRDICVIGQDVPDSLAVSQVFGLFMVVTTGIFLSLVGLASEIFIWHFKRANINGSKTGIDRTTVLTP